MKISCAVTILAASFLFAACEKKTETPPPQPTNGLSQNPLDAPANYVGALVKAQNAAVKTIDLASVNSAVSRFYVDEARWPKDLNELVEKKYLSEVPQPPRGMKFVYDANSGQAKMVKE